MKIGSILTLIDDGRSFATNPEIGIASIDQKLAIVVIKVH